MCSALMAVYHDMSEARLHVFPIFRRHDRLEPGKSINEVLLWRIEDGDSEIIWLKTNLRVVSQELERNAESILQIR